MMRQRKRLKIALYEGEKNNVESFSFAPTVINLNLFDRQTLPNVKACFRVCI